MADANNPGDLVSLDEATESMSAGAAGSQDSILDAGEMFQQQLEQISAWKQQIAGQMDAMRRDGIRLLERQKTLVLEKKQLADERAHLAGEREAIAKLQAEIQAGAEKLSQRAGELEGAQQRLAELEKQREQAQRELSAREKGLAEQEARHLSEDVRLREEKEQLEAQRRQLAEAMRQATHEREALDAKSAELAARAQTLEQQAQSLGGREQAVAAAQEQIAQAQAETNARLADLAGREQAVGEKIKAAEAEQSRLAGERAQLARQRQDLQKKLESFEQEQAESLESLAKQTKRLTEKRTEIEAAEADLEKALADRIAEATESLKQQLAQATAGGGERVAELEARLAQVDAEQRGWQEKEARLEQELSAAGAQLAKLTADLQQAQAALRQAESSLAQLAGERGALAQELEKQIAAAKTEAARWQEELESARTRATGGNEALTQAQADANLAREELRAVKGLVEQLRQAKDELEFQLEVRAEDSARQLENLRSGLSQQIAEREEELAQWKEKYQAAAAKPPVAEMSAADGEKLREMARQVQMLEQQRNDLAAQLFAVQDALRHQQEEALLAKNVLEGKLLALEEKHTTLLTEKASWQKRTTSSAAPSSAGGPQESWHRQRLLKQARALRGFRQQIRETQASLNGSRAEIAQQREQLRARKENLEQVKRLLEKQEMVMARKLADHNAIKTVAAVGIFVIMVLGSVFFGVYKFVRPVYRSEAVVQLSAPQELQGAELESWLAKQMEFVRSSDVTYAAWKILRSNEGHYVMHDVRDEWLGSLPAHLSMSLDSKGRTLSIRYTGPDSQGVSQVANALAAAYATPGLRDAEPTRTVGLGAKTIASATPSVYPVEDNRLMVTLSVVAITLFVSLLLVMIFRHFIARQLREIDQMADAQDLDEVQTELPDGAQPA